MLQLPSQPSIGERLPSSHSSAPSFRKPSPQNSIGSQGWPTVRQTYPASTWQLLEQPSVAAVPPSSHCSPAPTTESPHSTLASGTHTLLASLPVVQPKPGSTLHATEQPSPATALPSSQASTPATLPSP